MLALALLFGVGSVVVSEPPSGLWALLAAGRGAPAAEELAALLGHVPDRVEIRVGGPASASVRVVTWTEFAEAVDATRLGGALRGEVAPEGPVSTRNCQAAAAVGLYCGPDAGWGDAWGNCDSSSAWVLYRGAPPGSAYTELTPGTGPTPIICGGFFGPTVYWTAAELSVAKVPAVAASVLHEGCFSSRWIVHTNGYCPNPFRLGEGGPTGGALDTWLLHWRARGSGIAASFLFGDISLDYFIGLAATTCYDVPADFRFPGSPAVSPLDLARSVLSGAAVACP